MDRPGSSEVFRYDKRVTKLIMMKSDVLDTFETIKACVAYKVNGEEIDYFPV